MGKHILWSIAFCALVGLGCKPKPPKAPKAAAPSQKKSYVTLPLGILELPITPVDRSKPLALQGDMVVRGALVRDYPRQGLGAVGLSDISYLWPNARVPYVFDATDEQAKAIGLSSLDEFKKNMLAAMRLWEADAEGPTGWRFEEAGSDELNILSIGIDPAFDGGYAQIGRQFGSNNLKMGIHAFGDSYVAAHELGHALGLWHEQMHPERDKVLRINWRNIADEEKFNYAIIPYGPVNLLGPYDTNSIMHYTPYTFSIGFGYCQKDFIKRLRSSRKYEDCMKDFTTFDFVDGSEQVLGAVPSAGDYKAIRKLAATAKSTFVDPTTLDTEVSEVATSTQGPAYLELKKTGKSSFYYFAVQAQTGASAEATSPQPSASAGEVLAGGMLYSDRFYTNVFPAGSYTLTIYACTYPALSTTAMEQCGKEKALPFTVNPNADSKLADLHAAYAQTMLNREVAISAFFDALFALGDYARTCDVVKRGDLVKPVLEVSSQYGFKVDRETVLAVLSDTRVANKSEWDALVSKNEGVGLALAPKFDGVPSRVDPTPVRIDPPTRIDVSPPTRIDVGSPSRFDLDAPTRFGSDSPLRTDTTPVQPKLDSPLSPRARAELEFAPAPLSLKQRAAAFFKRRGLQIAGVIGAGILGFGLYVLHANLSNPKPESSSEAVTHTQCDNAMVGEELFREYTKEPGKALQESTKELESLSQQISSYAPHP